MNIMLLNSFYGCHERQRGRESWSMIHYLLQASSLPWCCIEDYNDLLSQSEKRGRRSHPDWLIKGFRMAIEVSGLIDLGTHGHFFTWEKSRGTPGWVEERLDRAMATTSWMSQFPNGVVFSMEDSESDHLPILMYPRSRLRRRRIIWFHFENAWIHD